MLPRTHLSPCARGQIAGSLKNHLQEKNYAKGDCTKKTCLYIGADDNLFCAGKRKSFCSTGDLAMAHVKMYIKPHCPYCAKAQQLLSELGVQNVEIIRVDNSDELFQEMKTVSGRHTVPQIFIGSTHVGGFTDMYALHQQGGLQVLLNQE